MKSGMPSTWSWRKSWTPWPRGCAPRTSAFSEHGKELQAHAATLAKATDARAVAGAHALLASEHEEARIAHHELVDAVGELQSLLSDDRSTDAGENKPLR